jgi:ABC-type transporter Mla maintaining outer membrane lipid asymmetry ATPase subunit MlaF
MNEAVMKEPWHLDRRVPVALILSILLQTGAGFWWASSINERVNTLESFRQDSKSAASDIAVMKVEIVNLKGQIVDLKAEVAGTNAILRRIEAQLAADRRD